MKELMGRAALVTGGGRGIGAATALALARLGASVAVAARNMDQVVEVAAMLRKDGFEAFAFQCDVAKPFDVRDVALAAREAMGPVGILVNNAGTAPSNPLKRVTLEEWNHVMAVNVTGTFLFTQALLPDMVHAGWGRVVNVASIAGLMGGKYMSAYTASKHAVVGFTRSMAAEVSGTGVTVNAVCPGYVDTPLTDDAVGRIVYLTGKSPEQARQLLLNEAGQSRLLTAGEVADAVVRLCLEGSASANGEAVVLDGKDGRV
ncbi:MAG TPA: SDR family oxidoreductase [Longimicrobiales bacterium]|nr:SDR family oxidoreductase [Longimicrobiales bacterium]